jgi:hypothetical protein
MMDSVLAELAGQQRGDDQIAVADHAQQHRPAGASEHSLVLFAPVGRSKHLLGLLQRGVQPFDGNRPLGDPGRCMRCQAVALGAMLPRRGVPYTFARSADLSGLRALYQMQLKRGTR